jgi:hypothetical protein
VEGIVSSLRHGFNPQHKTTTVIQINEYQNRKTCASKDAIKKVEQKDKQWLTPVNFSYLEGGNWKGHGLRPDWAKKSARPHLNQHC